MSSLPTRASRHQQVMRILADALEQPAEQRARFVQVACGDDVALSRSIESLLLHADADYSPGDDVARAARRVLDLAASVELGGRRLGAWQVVRRIGAGGMGAVYLAERTDPRGHHERAAVKVLRARVASDETLRRFRREQRILAEVDHPNVARLIDSGTTEEGLPYLVMEYVDGTPIDQYCDEHRLDVRHRLELFGDVCTAVQQAHDLDVVHRDLKPANVLVTRGGDIRLLDFGIAKLLTPEMLDCSVQLTAEFERLMTPGFASPEQVRGGEVTLASDVYSLGVMLYALVCGRSPYDGADSTDPERTVCGFTPPPPSAAVMQFARTAGPFGESIERTPEAVAAARATSAAELVAELEAGVDALVCTAIAKEPSRRYADAAEMAQAIEAYLREGSAISLIETTALSGEGSVAPPERKARSGSTSPSHAPAARPETRSHTIPAEWGHLQILDKLGEGMFGEVYKCLDPSLQKVRALKVNRARGRGGRAAAEIAERALSEGRLLARVEHPNVVRVLGAAVHDDAVGMWMEYVEGRNLEEFLQQNGRLSNVELAILGRDLASALTAVHAKGVIHRDIKAQNVIREVSGRVVLTDFGSGFDLAGHASVTEKIAGTPLYMAPEVLRGGAPTPQSDIYSLGVLLFRMATGKFPVESDSWDDLLSRHARGEAPLVRDVEPDVRQPIARVIQKALAPDPRKRYATAAEMLQELEAIVTPRDPRRWLPVALAGTAATIAGLGLLLLVGVVATITFEMSLGIPSDFVAASLGDYLITGLRAMIPGTISILICSFIIWSGLRIGSHVASKLGLRHDSLGSMPLGRRFVAVGLVGMVVAYFAYADLWTAISALRYSGLRGEADFSLLSNVSYQIVHEWAYAFLASAMLVGICAVWYRARERGDGGARLFGLYASMAAIALLAILRMSMGWKLLVEPQPTFIYQPDADATARWVDPRARTGDLSGARGFVLGRNGDELWVYFPEVLHGMPLAASSIADPTETEGIFYYGAATTTNR